MFIVKYYDPTPNHNEFVTEPFDSKEEAEREMWDLRIQGYDAYVEQEEI